jgi:hypothetical protein
LVHQSTQQSGFAGLARGVNCEIILIFNQVHYRFIQATQRVNHKMVGGIAQAGNIKKPFHESLFSAKIRIMDS